MKKIISNKTHFKKKIYSLSSSISAILLSLILVNCSSNNKLEITPTIQKPKRVTSLDTVSNENEPLPFDVLKLDPKISKNHVIYNFILQGWYSSGGLRPNTIASIQIKEENTKDNSLIINCTVTIKKIPGKESNLVTGYNFTKPFSVKTDKNIKTVIIHIKEAHSDKADQIVTKAIKTFDV